MGYASMGVLALVIQLIIDYDVFRMPGGHELIPAHKQYRRFLISLSIFYLTDASWGMIYDARIMPLARLATTFFFATVAMTVFLWTRYVIAYLDKERIFRYILSVAGWLFLLVEAFVLLINEAYPLVFYFEKDGEYVPCRWRYIMLNVQVVLFLLTALYTLYTAIRTEGKLRNRYLTIGLSGLALTVLIAEQTKYPLLPLYSVGCLLSVCIIHRFVVEGEKDDYRKELEELLAKEKRQRVELGTARDMVYTDALTGVKSKYAYSEEEERMQQLIDKHEAGEFAVVVLDVNGLKYVNDNIGHEQGDRLLKDACHFICRFFAHSPVFRIGGDEFFVLLTGEDHKNRVKIMEEFNREMEANLRNGGVVVAAGTSDYDERYDTRFCDIFGRADREMYERKRVLKVMSGV